MRLTVRLDESEVQYLLNEYANSSEFPNGLALKNLINLKLLDGELSFDCEVESD